MTNYYIPEDLLLSLNSERVHLLIGSGPSVAATLQGWDDLSMDMRTVIGRETKDVPAKDLGAFLASADFLDIADVFKETVKQHRYFSFLRERYRRDVPLSRLHKVIAKCPVKTVFTTNYDKLLETAFRLKGSSDPPVVVFPEQLGHIDDTQLRIIKLHGDIDHPSTIVLTRKDYASYSSRHKEFIRRLQSSINDYTILLIGFGLRDPNFLRIYQDARHLFDSTQRQAYAIMTGTYALERHLWEDDGLTILPARDHKQIPSYVTRILDEARRRAPSP